MIVSTADHAADCPRDPVRVEAVGVAAHGRPSWDQRDDYLSLGSRAAAAQMWSRTDLEPGDVDCAQLYDGFSFLTLDWLEALGFCPVGASGAFVEGGARIGLGGELPLNTYGGQLSAGRLHGYWLLHEACAQLQGRADQRQVADAEVVAIAAGGGGPIGGCMLLTR
jgi:acetyl-CoA acetyltransferase